MFKKPSDVKALQRLSGADRKKLRRSIRDKFLQATDADIDVILPLKAEISVAKLANRVHVYTVDGGPPMLFDVDGRGTDIFPTVYALWKLPALLPAFVLKGAEVSRYVVGGADLMFPGVDIPPEGLPTFQAGEPWAIKVPGNDYPIAVGATAISSEGALKAGFRGKALRVMHYYPDSLWDSAEGKCVPNAGFMADIVKEDPSTVVHQVPEVPPNTADVPVAEEPDVQQQQEPVPHMNELTLTDHPAEAVEVGSSIAVENEDVDSLLDRCLLQALHTTVKDRDLPMPASTLWSGHILPCRPPGSMLDIKKSSHKKLSKWIQAKSSAGLISAKEDKHRKEVILLAVNRGHSLYKEFVPEKRPATSETIATSSDAEAPALGLEIMDLWKSTPHVAPIFGAMSADTSKYYTAQEAADVVYGYVEKENLVKPVDKAIVVLDAPLCDALFKGAVKKGTSYPTEIHKKDLGGTFLKRMQANHKVTRGSESVVKKGAAKCVQMITERRQGNKKVTRLSGVESFLVNADALAAELQKKFACSTAVAELPGKKGESEILVQGGVLEDLGKHLVQHYGIPKRYIEIMDKTKK